jgi:hypothetical protein
MPLSIRGEACVLFSFQTAEFTSASDMKPRVENANIDARTKKRKFVQAEG